jgi:hypothetical protein
MFDIRGGDDALGGGPVEFAGVKDHVGEFEL